MILRLLAVGCLLAGGWALLAGGVPDDLAKELPRIPPTEPAEALATFRVHDGFRLIPAAAEPRLTDPVSAAFDADGRLYVVEMRGYPYADDVPPGVLRRLEDRDSDGVFEISQTLLEGLSWPTSVVPFDGGVFVTAPPDILYVKDTDDDGKADLRRVVFTGFGTQNVQALLNGLLWGPDGWIYGANGGNGGEIRNPAHPERPAVSIRGRDFRFRPDGSAFESISGGGQFGHTFDDWGHRFVCNNSNHIRQVVFPAWAADRNPDYTPPSPVLDIAAEGGAAPVFRISPAEPWRIVRTRQRAADPNFVRRAPPTELVPIGFFTSATGVTIYRGTAFPAEFRGNGFIGDVGGNLIHRKRLERNGSVYRAVRADDTVEFLASTDNWFRPVNFANTPSGTLLILDMYRETIEHPASIPDPIKRHLDLTSGHDRGRLYELVPDGFQRRPQPRLSSLTDAELVPLLDDRDAWWRETAQRLLIERNAVGIVPQLKTMARERPSALGRLHALWLLAAFDRLDIDDLLPAFCDPEPGVREQAALLSRPLLESETAAKPIQDAVLALVADADGMVRFQASLVLGARREPEVLRALASLAVQSGGDPWIRAAVLSGLTRGKAAAFLRTLDHLDPAFLGSNLGRPWLSEVTQLLAAQGDREGIRDWIRRATAPETPPVMTRTILLAIGRGLRRSGGSLDASLGEVDPMIWASLKRTAAEQAANPAADPSARVEAIGLLGLVTFDEARDALAPLLDGREPVTVQLAALEALGARTDAGVGDVVVESWKRLGPATRREAAEILFARRDRVLALLRGIADGLVAPTDLDPLRRRQLLESPDPTIRSRASELMGNDGQSDRAKVVQDHRAALDLAADRERGKAAYLKHCASCHQAQGLGVAVGPDLATVATRTPEDLLTHILDPNREVAPNYVNYSIATTDGRVLSGLIADESPTAITLLRGEGVRDVIPRSQIETIASTGLSLMPEGLEREIDRQSLADLIAFLRGADLSTSGASGR